MDKPEHKIMSGVEFVKMLKYLERTSRFREGPALSRMDFKAYILWQYGMSMKTYEKLWQAAFGPFRELAETFGPGLVAEVLEKFEEPAADRVIKKIEKYISKRKTAPPAGKIRELIRDEQIREQGRKEGQREKEKRDKKGE